MMFYVFGHLIVQILKFKDDFKYKIYSYTLILLDLSFDDLKTLDMVSPSRRCLHLELVGGLEWSKDPESAADSSEATGRAFLAGQVDGDDPD
jgi:hypothetical protein